MLVDKSQKNNGVAMDRKPSNEFQVTQQSIAEMLVCLQSSIGESGQQFVANANLPVQPPRDQTEVRGMD